MKPLNRWNLADVIAFAKTVEKRTWVIVLSSAVGFLLVVILLVIPAWIERPLLRRDIQSMEAQIRQVNALNEKRQGWEENQKIFGSLIEETQKRVFTEDSLGMLLGQISKMAGESRVDMLASRPLTEKAFFPAPYHLKYQPSGYEFTVQGGYHDLGNLTSRIENYDKLLRIRSLEITPDGKTPGRHIAELKLWAILKAPPQAAVPAKKAVKAKNAKK
ncbi:MAG: type 4a pilus biogenesis protein PilO [Candidatus Omnitrophota bacterium]